MTLRTFWAISLVLALLSWVGLLYFTGGVPPSDWAVIVASLILALAVAATSAPLIWLIARPLHLELIRKQPGAALRMGSWLGLWIAICTGLQLFKVFNWALALTLAVIFGLLEGFVQQIGGRGGKMTG